jgi:phenylpyruvate tautomerase PptA (4-oxalocrotonate tautomerase family)
MTATATHPDKENNMPLTQVKVMEGVFSACQKQEIIEGSPTRFVEIEGESMRRLTWCVIEESPAALGASAATPSPPPTSRHSSAARRHRRWADRSFS